MYHKLFEEDYNRRVQTVKQLLHLLQHNSLENFIYFSDNTQNCRKWISEKSIVVWEYQDNT